LLERILIATRVGFKFLGDIVHVRFALSTRFGVLRRFFGRFLRKVGLVDEGAIVLSTALLTVLFPQQIRGVFLRLSKAAISSFAACMSPVTLSA